MVQDVDFYCHKGYYPSNSTALEMQAQEITAKDSRLEESKVKEVKTSLFWVKTDDFFKQARKKKKKEKAHKKTG